MHGPERKAPAAVVAALGLTQIIGYGTLYYSFSILAPAMAADLGLSLEWTFGALSVALILGSLLAPKAGQLADRHGAGRIMAAGSVGVAVSMVAFALSPDWMSCAAALVAMEVAACFILYSTAFVAVVQTGPAGAQRSITYLTLIGGFASTLFWPLTSEIHRYLNWREVYFVFAAMHLVVALPIHLWVGRLTMRAPQMKLLTPDLPVEAAAETASPRPVAVSRWVFSTMMAGFAIGGFVQSAILVHMVPMLVALGAAGSVLMVSTLFGPSQVAARLVNMMFGGRLRQSVLAIVSLGLLAAGLGLLLAGAPASYGLALFAVFFGMGSGLLSIVGGTLPLEVFGRAAYGSYVGWMSGARQFSSALAPFAFSVMMVGLSVETAIVLVAAVAIAGVATFALVARLAPATPAT